MREIKFRAWDKKAKCMVELGRPVYDGGLGAFRMNAIKPMFKFDNWEEQSTNLMQFTGLKDKNGKEIFEGDILHTDITEANGLARNFVVEYEPSSGFIGGRTEGKNPAYCCTVIGNIYENPELLKP